MTAHERIRLFDLSRQFATVGSDVRAAIDEVLAEGVFLKGRQGDAFEREFAAYCGASHAVGMSSGTTALELIYRAYGIGPGDEVLVPANSSVCTAFAVSNVGATPILVDVDPRTGNIDPQTIAPAVTARTKAVVPVHLWGRPAPMDEVRLAARSFGLYVFEDASQAHGARYRGERVGTLGDAAAFSLHPSKNLGAYGDAGIAVTNDASIAEKLAALRDIGQVARYTHAYVGVNGRLDEIQAAILRVKLRDLDAWIAGRRAAAAQYAELFAGTRVVTPSEFGHEECVYHLYVLDVPRRVAVCAALDAARIDWGIHYPQPIHRQGAYAGTAVASRSLPNADALAERILSIPMFAEIRADECARVAEVILGVLS